MQGILKMQTSGAKKALVLSVAVELLRVAMCVRCVTWRPVIKWAHPDGYQAD